MSRLGRSLSWCVLTLILAITSLAFASSTATLTGRVVDPNGAVIVGAKVEATNIATNVASSTETNSEGLFVIANLPPGHYRVAVQKQGFQTVVRPEVELHVQDVISLNFSMQLGSITQSVTIQGGTSLAQTETAAVGTLVDRQFVGNLPLNGRSFQSLITLSPGVVLTKTSTAEPGQFSVNGQRANANYFTVDGVSANIGVSPGNTAGESTAGTIPGFATTGGTNNLVSVDALQEFKILTSTFAPEFGRTPGAQISVVTRSGTNDFHGTLFEYFRNDALDANDWFANQKGLPRPAERQNQFGGVFGGPLYLPRFGEGGPAVISGKNRTFFFFSYEGLRLRLPQTGLTTVPSVTVRQQVPASIQPYLNAYPIPNGRILTGGFAEFNASFSDPSTLDATSIRVDHVVSQRLTLFSRYNYSPSETIQRGFGDSLNESRVVSDRTHTLTGGAILAIGRSMSNDFRANYSRNEGHLDFALDNFGGAVTVPETSLFPSSISTRDGEFVFSLGGTAWSVGPFGTDIQRQINLVDSLSVVAGVHQLKFGVDYRRLFPIFNRVRYTQQIFFNDVAAAQAGRASLTAISSFDGPRFPIFNNLSIFGQDSWKLKPRVVLTYGLRWELNPPPSDAHGVNPVTVTGLSNPATLDLAPAGTPLYKTRYNNFAPRVGLAYQLSQNKGRETVLRGGFGVFYDLGTGPAAGAFGVAFPYFRIGIASGVAFPLDSVAAAPIPFSATPSAAILFGVIDPDFKLPYTYQWNVSVERSLGSNQSATATYVGAVGRRLLRQETISNPNPKFRTVQVARNSATSDYHALQLQFQRRLSKGMQALASYTWSHSLDNVSSESSLEAPITRVDPRQERGPSDFDVRHALNAAVTYDIPAPFGNRFVNVILRNFSVDNIFTARSATPVNVVTGTSIIGGNFVSRPDLVAGVPLYIDDPNVGGGRRINPAAFTIPVGRQGTLGRNAMRGFPMWQLDLALRRQFHLAEKVNLQFRAEFFNIFNHPNFADPGLVGSTRTSALNNSLFGRSIAMLGRSLGTGGRAGFNPLYQVGGPRSIQFSLKLAF